MKKVLIIVGAFPPDFSGAGIRALKYCKRMTKKYKQNFNVFCLKLSSCSHKPSEALSIKRISTIPVRGLFFPFYLIQVTINSFIYLTKNRKDIDIIHIFTFCWLNRMIVFLNILFFNKKTLLEITLDGVEDPESLVSLGIKNKILAPFTRFLLKRIDVFVALNPYSQQSCLDFGVPKANIWLRPNPVNEEEFKPDSTAEKNQVRRKLNLPNKFTMLCVGEINERKNQLFLLKMLYSIKDMDCQLVLVGPIDDPIRKTYLGEVKEYIKDNDLGDKVIITGRQQNINEYMNASDLFVFSSKREGFASVFAESMMSGVPIVALDLDGIRQYINEDNGYLLPNSIKSLNKFTDLVKKIINKQTTFDKKQIREFALEYFSTKKIDEQYWKIYKSLRYASANEYKHLFSRSV